MPEFTVTFSDSPLAPPGAGDPNVEVWRDQDGTVCAYGYTEGVRHWMHLPGLARFRIDAGSGEIRAITPLGTPPDLLRDAYQRMVLPMALQALGQEVLHASAVRTPRGVVALCGVSASGKSTLACGLSRRGYPLWADDAVLFEASAAGVMAIPLPFRLRLRPASASYFTVSSLRDPAVPAKTEPVPLAAVCVLCRGTDAEIAAAVRLSPAQAFPAVLAHAYCFSLQDTERKRRMLLHYMDLTVAAPIFEIRFAAGLNHLPAILDRIESMVLGA